MNKAHKKKINISNKGIPKEPKEKNQIVETNNETEQNTEKEVRYEPKNDKKILNQVKYQEPKKVEKKKRFAFLQDLRVLNAGAGVLHLTQGLVMLFLSKEVLRPIVWNLPNPPVIRLPIDQNAPRPEIVLSTETWFSINLGYSIATFLLLSAFFHFFIILPQVYPKYLANLKKEINYYRWYEYALSSSLMVLVIAMLCNINNAGILIPIVAINACMNLFGASMEVHNSTLKGYQTEEEQKIGNKTVNQGYKTDWSNFIYGCFAGAIPWVVMGVYFFTSLDRLGKVENLPTRFKEALDTVRFIFPALFVFFNLFAINMFLQYKKLGPWKNYIFGEKGYILLSLLAKSFLAWFIWGGTLRG